jgi:primosomal protein N' (replication factor Y)
VHEEGSGRVGVLVPGGFPGVPSYRIPYGGEAPVIGARVAVPFGARVLTGVAADLAPEPLAEGTVERELVAVLDEAPFLPPPLVGVLLRASAYYFVAAGEMLRAAVPARLLAAAEAVYAPAPGAVGSGRRNARQEEILAEVLARGRARVSELAASLGSHGLGPALRALVADGLLRIPSESARAATAPSDKAWVARPAPRDHPAFARSPKRRALHAQLVALGRPARLGELRAAGGSPAVLAALVKAGLASVVEEERRVDLSRHVGALRGDVTHRLTEPQTRAVEAIAAALSSGAASTFLLDGVTGSGKTEVYLAALERTRAAGRQGILLVPEIALAPALVRRVVARFGDRVSLLHSGLSDGERAAEWERARRGDVDAVVGPRSAVFAPVPRLGLVVVDEAHEASYKQSESPRYDARDVARVRASEEGAVLVLGSATPSMEQERAAREGRVPRLALPERPGARERADVEVVDLREEKPREGDHGRVLFAERTRQILAETFARGEQAILLLNRRGFSPTLLCRACGEDFRCRNCSVARTYHQRGGGARGTAEVGPPNRPAKLLCHYCSDAIPRPSACPRCASRVLQPIGFGTERLAERFEEAFPDVTYAVLDRDAAARRGGAAGVLADFEEGRARALLGTQMVAKGHDFPNATALAVLDADALLSFPDFRAAERTFQLVTQAAGRVGRGEKAGLVAVQTCRPEHEAIRAAVAQDHAAFADSELRFRRAFRYPPYAHLLLALWTAPEARDAEAAARVGAATLLGSAVAPRLRVLGPAPAPLERLHGAWRFHVLVKADARDAIAEAGHVLAALREAPRLDVDPQNLL